MKPMYIGRKLLTNLLIQDTETDYTQCQSTRAMSSRLCKNCNQQFVQKSGRQDYCSPECKAAFNKKPKKSRVLNCQQCGTSFTPTGSTSKFCSSTCRDLSYKMSGREKRTCAGCDVDMTAEYVCKLYCTTECQRRHQSQQKYTGTEGIDYIVCPVCEQRVRQISHRHAEMHGYQSAADMAEKLNMTAITCQSFKDMVTGENNPAYDHGGKYSAWSKNFIHGYDESRHQNHNQQMVKLRENKKHLFKNNLEYWIQQANGDAEVAKQMYKNFQTKDLQRFVDLYGEQEGKTRHMAKTVKWLNTLNSKPLEELNKINARKVKKSGCFYSKAELEIFNELKKHVAELTDQFAICRDPEEKSKKFYLYDMQYQNKIIEYNGDFWHANPAKYDESFVNPYTKQTFKQITDKDADKLNLAKKSGYTVKIVWENDYKKDPQRVIQECLQFLKT
jgi:hypothetical protein